jgi:integrase
MGKLTDVQLREWVKVGKAIAGKSDGDGLTFTLSAKGAASWVLRYRYAGRQRELTLGNYPRMSLKEARIRATEARAEIDTGKDVATERQRERHALIAAGTVRDLAADYLARVGPTLAETTRGETARCLDKDVLPRIGGMLAREVAGADIVRLVETVAARSQSMARRVFEMLSVLFAHGLAKHVVTANPCAGIKVSAVIGARQPKRARVKLTRDELAALLVRLPEIGRENALAVKIILATCVRKGELIRARWEHLDTDAWLWTVPAENSKSGKGFGIPLPPIVAGWFEELRALAGRSEFVLPARSRRTSSTDRPICENTLNAALGRLGFERHFSPHDLRSTARSYLAELGVPVVVAERCLNHSLGGLVEVYDQHDYIDERRAALESWAALLVACESGEAGKVVPIRSKAA